MQLLSLTSGLPVYLPYDTAHAPFGDPFNDVTITSSTTAVVSVPGYVPTVSDQVLFTTNSGGTLAAGISANFVYYVVAPVSGNTFAIASTKGGSVIATTTSTSTSGQVTVHLLSGQTDGTVQPFKTGDTVVALNLGAATVTLQGAPDTYELAPGSIYPIAKTPPGGPSAYSTIASIASGTAKLVVLGYDWVNASGGGLILLQN